MAKKLMGRLKLQVPAGAANPSPPIGPALGQRGINIMEFCKAFNARTEGMEKGVKLPVLIDYYQDKSFTFIIKSPPGSALIMKAAGLKKGSLKPGYEVAGSISMDQCREIAQVKMNDLNANDVEAGARIIAGQARSMGIEVTG